MLPYTGNCLPILEALRLFLFLTSLAWRCENFFAHQSSPSPSHSPHHYPFTPVEPGYGVVLYEGDYLLLLLAADLRMDSALRPRPVSSVAFVYLGNAYDSTTRLNDGIFTVHQFSVATSARLHQSECVFRFYVSAEYLTTHRDYYLHVERVVFVFCFFLFLLFECKQWGPHPPKEHSSP
jgi:hypothetical protein